MLDPVRDQAEGGNSSSSDYFTCISFDRKLIPNDKQGKTDSRLSELREGPQLLVQHCSLHYFRNTKEGFIPKDLTPRLVRRVEWGMCLQE